MDKATRARLGIGQAKEQVPPPAAPPTAPPAPPDKAAARKARKAACPKLKHRCGHEYPVSNYTNLDCGPCRDAARRIKNRARAERKAAAKAAAKATEATSSCGRLPNASSFFVGYDATAQLWTGSLSIPGTTPFCGQHSNLWKLLKALDAAYRGLQNGPPAAAENVLPPDP